MPIPQIKKRLAVDTVHKNTHKEATNGSRISWNPCHSPGRVLFPSDLISFAHRQPTDLLIDCYHRPLLSSSPEQTDKHVNWNSRLQSVLARHKRDSHGDHVIPPLHPLFTPCFSSPPFLFLARQPTHLRRVTIYSREFQLCNTIHPLFKSCT